MRRRRRPPRAWCPYLDTSQADGREWVPTLIFYTAIHLTEALLAEKAVHPGRPRGSCDGRWRRMGRQRGRSLRGAPRPERAMALFRSRSNARRRSRSQGMGATAYLCDWPRLASGWFLGDRVTTHRSRRHQPWACGGSLMRGQQAVRRELSSSDSGHQTCKKSGA